MPRMRERIGSSEVTTIPRATRPAFLASATNESKSAGRVMTRRSVPVASASGAYSRARAWNSSSLKSAWAAFRSGSLRTRAARSRVTGTSVRRVARCLESRASARCVFSPSR